MKKVLHMMAATLAAGTFLGSPANARDVIIHAGHLIDGTSRQTRDQVSIIIKDDRIIGVESGFVDRPGAEVINLSDKTVLPGLIDMHVHLGGQFGGGSPIVARVTETSYDGIFDSTIYARKTVMAGFTSVRDCGGYTPASVALKKAADRGKIIGPRMWLAGSVLTPTGGHGDMSSGFDELLVKPEWVDGIIDSPEEAVKAVRRHHKQGTQLIKIVPSGGVLSVGDDPNVQSMSDEEIKAVVDTAHVLHMKVAAHAHGAAAVEHASRLGVDSIEHGTYTTPEGDKVMKEKGTYLVPTLIAGATVLQLAKSNPGAMPPSAVAKAEAIGPIMAANFYRAYKSGVKIAFGTDASVFPHGENAKEFELMVQAGMPAIDAILSATKGAADLMGAPQDIGSVQAGRFADIIAVDGDPIKDITTLQNVTFVMKGGSVVKDASKPLL